MMRHGGYGVRKCFEGGSGAGVGTLLPRRRTAMMAGMAGNKKEEERQEQGATREALRTHSSLASSYTDGEGPSLCHGEDKQCRCNRRQAAGGSRQSARAKSWSSCRPRRHKSASQKARACTHTG